MTKIVDTHWDGGMRFTSADSLGGAATMEGAEGQDGFRPSALLLAALAGCTAMDVISICTKKRQPIERYDVRTTGEQRRSHPRTFETITVEHEFSGHAIDLEAVRRAIELSATRYCPVTATLSAGDVRISHRYLVHADDGDHQAEVVVTGPNGAGLDPILPTLPPGA